MVSHSNLPPDAEPAEVDRLVSASMEGGESTYRLDRLRADSLSLVDKYPRDPRAHLFRGLYLLERRDVADAEPYFRDARRLGETSPVMTRAFQDWNLALLALTVRVQNRDAEPKTIVAPLCADIPALDRRTQQTLEITKLCNW